MTSLGIWACRWRELRPINFGGNARSTVPIASNPESGETPEDEGAGFSRGRGRGRGRDGSGGYEMVGMDEQAESNV